MVFKHERSEEYRARLYFCAGTISCTPLCVNVFYGLQNKLEYIPPGLWIVNLTLFIFGFMLINKSYLIMEGIDEKC